MKFELYWEEGEGELLPCCQSDDVNNDGISLVSCLLMDDGGIPYKETIQWIEEGINNVELVCNKTNTSLDWSREAWGASLSSEVTKIYYLHDEGYFFEISTSNFRAILKIWLDFLNSIPSLNDKVIFEYEK